MSYSTREHSTAPYNRTLEVSREDQRESGLVVPCGIALLEYDQDIDKLHIPEGVILPSDQEVYELTMQRKHEQSPPVVRHYENLVELNSTLTQFVAEAMRYGRNFSLRYSDYANEDEESFLRGLGRSGADVEYRGGMYL